MNEKFVPYAAPWSGPREKWFADAWSRFWKKQDGTHEGWLLGTQFVITSSAGRSLSGKIKGKDGTAPALKEILAAYAKLPEAERRPKTVADDNKPMPAPPANGLVFTIYDRPLGRDDQGRYRLPKGSDLGSLGAAELCTCAPAGQRSSLWLTEEECQSLIPQDPKKGETQQVPAKLAKRIWLFGLWPDTLWVVEGAWLPNSVRAGELKLTVEEASPQVLRLRVHGSVLLVGMGTHLKNKAQSTPAPLGKNVESRYDTRLEGTLVYDRVQKRIAKWDMVALGDYTGEWFPQQGGWREARPDAPLRLAFSFESDRSDYDFPERRRPRSFVHGYIFGGDRGQVREQYYWDPERWEADWRKTQPGK